MNTSIYSLQYSAITIDSTIFSFLDGETSHSKLDFESINPKEITGHTPETWELASKKSAFPCWRCNELIGRMRSGSRVCR